uniref:Carbonic anhydrase n=1 Tax=Ascaris lumbricoides TaxID=6252 RepID=A0A0M3HFE1_ASCLU
MHRILNPPINRVYSCWNNYYDAVTPEKQFSSPDVVVVMPCVVQYSRGSEDVVSV